MAKNDKRSSIEIVHPDGKKHTVERPIEKPIERKSWLRGIGNSARNIFTRKQKKDEVIVGNNIIKSRVMEEKSDISSYEAAIKSIREGKFLEEQPAGIPPKPTRPAPPPPKPTRPAPPPPKPTRPAPQPPTQEEQKGHIERNEKGVIKITQSDFVNKTINQAKPMEGRVSVKERIRQFEEMDKRNRNSNEPSKNDF